MLHNGGLELFLKQREELRSNARSHPCDVAIGAVFAPNLFFSMQVGAQFESANRQERADDRSGDGMNSSKACEARASQQVREHSLCLIVCRVCHGDSRAGTGIRQRAEIVITSATRGILEIRSFLPGFLCDVQRCGVKFKVVPGGQPGDEFFVGVGSFAT
jgi:hypothetical protein